MTEGRTQIRTQKGQQWQSPAETEVSGEGALNCRARQTKELRDQIPGLWGRKDPGTMEKHPSRTGSPQRFSVVLLSVAFSKELEESQGGGSFSSKPKQQRTPATEDKGRKEGSTSCWV